MKTRVILEWMGAVALAVIFAGAALPKILDPHNFALMVFRYQILPYALINVAAIFLPWIELVLAVALLWPGRARRGASLLALLLLVVFSSALLFNLARGINVACGCFSVDPDARHNAVMSVVRDFVFVALAVATFWCSTRDAAPAERKA